MSTTDTGAVQRECVCVVWFVGRTSFSISFSIYSTVRTLVSPEIGQTYSSVLEVIFSSNNFSFSLMARIGPCLVRMAIRGTFHGYKTITASQRMERFKHQITFNSHSLTFNRTFVDTPNRHVDVFVRMKGP